MPRRFLLVLAAMVPLLSASLCQAQVPDWLERPGTIRHALSQPDLTHVYLDAVVVEKNVPEENYCIVREVFDPASRIFVMMKLPQGFRLNQTVDVEGDLSTLVSGHRAVESPTIYAYLDPEDGSFLYNGPLIKGLLERTVWESMAAFTDVPTFEMLDSGMMMTMEEDEGDPEPPDPDPSPLPTPLFCSTIADAKLQDDGALIEMQCKPVLSVSTDHFVMSEDPEGGQSSETIPVYWNTAPVEADRVNVLVGTVKTINQSDKIICIDRNPAGVDPPVWDPAVDQAGFVQVCDDGNISHARTWPDGTVVALTGVVVTANQSDFPGSIYVEQPNSCSGTRVNYSGSYQPGRWDTVNVTGTIATATDGERVVNAGSTGVQSASEPQDASRLLCLVQKTLGGSKFNNWTPGIGSINDPRTHLYNKGMLVKITGKVTAVNSTDFYVDDGSNLSDGSGNTGVKVSWNWPNKPAIVPPQVGWYVSAVGISSSDTSDSGATYYRVLRPRDQNDLDLFTPVDVTAPSVDITSPPGGEMHLAAGQTAALLKGTATDADSSVVKVEVGTGSPTTWARAEYDPLTHIWTYNWTSPSSGTIYVRATDFAGNTTNPAYSRAVTVSSGVSVVYVSPSGNNSTGQSWNLAYTTVTAAVAAASSNAEIWVAEGEYQGVTINKSNVGIYGGFKAGDTYREERQREENVTIIDGSSSSGAVVTVQSGKINVTLDGFTIWGGSNGRGVYCDSNSSATISHNIIRDNPGGGIGVSSCTATITNNTITGNGPSESDIQGAGIHIYGCGGDVKIANNLISGNRGDGVYIYYSRPEVLNNTIVGNVKVNNSSGAGIHVWDTYHDGHATVANNILAFNACGIHTIQDDTTFVLLKNNCSYGNSEFQYEDGVTWYTGSGDNISDDPRFVNREAGDFHIFGISPCYNTGDNGVSLPNDEDMDCEARRSGAIDRGADETSECVRYSVSVTPEVAVAAMNDSVTVLLEVFDSVDDALEPNYPVHIGVDVGEILSVNGASVPEGTQQLEVVTDSAGQLDIEVVRQDCGYLNVEARIIQPCEETFDTASIWFYDTSPVDIFFCMDSTSSMWGLNGDHGAQASVKAFLTEMTAMYPGLQFGVGIVRFNDGRRSNPYIPDSIDSSQVKLLSQFTTLSALINWIDTTYTPVGGDDYELQLDALHIAVHDMMNSSARRKYVVLLTDSPFHDNEGGSTVTKQHVLDDITALGCPVYLSLWDIFGELSQYSDFVSIGCEYAWANYTGNDTSGNWKYPLEDLRARIPWE